MELYLLSLLMFYIEPDMLIRTLDETNNSKKSGKQLHIILIDTFNSCIGTSIDMFKKSSSNAHLERRTAWAL
ncbi:hypothetical protein PanWU01x14_220390 [Parasponia andersonii]|uniref:Uncharacterized protein n=1 Tax=Parasponia andersonii TaxID=3476 RepID=A0A2P5BQ17_PARAD|nr:hypothetical protein PanWU01x14_220390 [Parasponia andersonii]